VFRFLRKNLLKSLGDDRNLSYQPHPQGLREARQAVQGYYRRKGYDVAPENIFLTSSTSEAYSAIFRLLLNVKENVLVPAPSYPLFEFLIQLNDLESIFYPLIYEGHWHIDLEALSSLVTPRTKAVVLVNPNNPTGSFLKPEERKRLNSLCRKHSLALICDEVFLDYVFQEEGQSALSLVDNKEVLTFILGGISKSLGLPQMKLSWIVVNGPEDAVKESKNRLEVILDTYLSVNTPVQNALSKWLDSQNVIQKEISERLRQNREFLKRHTASFSGCQLLHTEGGWYAILHLFSRHTEEEWVLMFLDDERVFVHPGYFFDFREEPYIVVSLLVPPAVFQEGCSRIFKRMRGVLEGARTG
jgi:hypothetical protein